MNEKLQYITWLIAKEIKKAVRINTFKYSEDTYEGEYETRGGAIGRYRCNYEEGIVIL